MEIKDYLNKLKPVGNKQEDLVSTPLGMFRRRHYQQLLEIKAMVELDNGEIMLFKNTPRGEGGASISRFYAVYCKAEEQLKENLPPGCVYTDADVCELTLDGVVHIGYIDKDGEKCTYSQKLNISQPSKKSNDNYKIS